MKSKELLAVGALLLAAAVTAHSAARHGAARPARAQKHAKTTGPQAPDTSSSLKSETRLITVDVSVRDAHGRPVRGLKARDFQIFDDGRGPQQIAGFEFIEPPNPRALEPAATKASERAPGMEAKPDPVYSNEAFAHLAVPPTAILLDPGSIAFGDQVTARLQALKLLDKLPADTPVAIFLLAHGLTVVRNFTTDRTVLRAAVNRSMTPLPQVKNPESDSQNSFSTAGTGAQDAQEFQKLEYEEQTTVIADQTSDAMRAIAKDLAGYPGQKNLVWISEAFPQWILPGAGFGPNSPEAGDDSSLANPFRQEFSGSANYGERLRSDAQALVDARVTVYPVDARGLETPELYSASGNLLATNSVYASNPAAIGPAMGAELTRENTDRDFAQATMEQIAADTGGRACRNTNDLSGCATTAVEDGSPDYEISYYPTGLKWDGSFHRITLKTDLHGVKIQYRRGYSAIDTAALAKKRPLQLFEQACASLLPVTSIGLKAEALLSKPGESRYLLSVSPRTLSVIPTGDTLALHLQVGVCEFAPREGRFRIYTHDFSKKFVERDGKKWQSQDVASVIDYKARPETTRLRLAVLDTATGLTGSVDVPAHPRVVFDIGGIGGEHGGAGMEVSSETGNTAGAAKLYSRLEFHSSNGESGRLDLSGDEIEYRGKLGIALSAPAFFHEVYGSVFQCEAGKLAANAGHSGEQPIYRFAFKNSGGLMAIVDLAGREPAYRGALPVDASAREFFERLWKLCHCEQP
jgi:VWFA-related protein